MGTIIRSALIATITVAGGFAALLFLRHSGWAWALLGGVAGAGAIGETAFRVATSRLHGHPIGVRQALEIAAPVGVVTVAVAAAILVAWLGSEVVTAGGSDAEKTAWGIGVGGITAGLSAAFVDPLKDGGINARRIRTAFRRTFETDSGLPINLQKSIMTPGQQINWSTWTDRRDRAREFDTYVHPSPRDDRGGTSGAAQPAAGRG